MYDIIVRPGGGVSIDPPTVTEEQLESLEWALTFMRNYERKKQRRCENTSRRDKGFVERSNIEEIGGRNLEEVDK